MVQLFQISSTLRGLGFVEVSADEHKSVLLHARKIVARVLAGR
jgi:hypothetical protein